MRSPSGMMPNRMGSAAPGSGVSMSRSSSSTSFGGSQRPGSSSSSFGRRSPGGVGSPGTRKVAGKIKAMPATLPPVPLLSNLVPAFCLQIIMAEQFIFDEDSFLKMVKNRADRENCAVRIQSFYKGAVQRKKFIRGMVLNKEKRFRQMKRKEKADREMEENKAEIALLHMREQELQAEAEMEQAAAKELGA